MVMRHARLIYEASIFAILLKRKSKAPIGRICPQATEKIASLFCAVAKTTI